MTIEELNAAGEQIERILKLRTHPVALKMLEKEADIPAGAVRPRRDNGQHLAICQAFSLARRQGQTIAMLTEDHWCFAPLIAYGLIEDKDDEFLQAFMTFPCFEYGKYIGTVTAPLNQAAFPPDVVLVYADPGRIRRILMSLKMAREPGFVSEFDAIDSCAFSVVPPVLTGEYRITFPDPGEHARAAAADDEVIFSVPAAKLTGFLDGLERMQETGREDIYGNIYMLPDFPRPDFYTRLFEKWGLDTEEDFGG